MHLDKRLLNAEIAPSPGDVCSQSRLDSAAIGKRGVDQRLRYGDCLPAALRKLVYKDIKLLGIIEGNVRPYVSEQGIPMVNEHRDSNTVAVDILYVRVCKKRLYLAHAYEIPLHIVEKVVPLLRIYVLCHYVNCLLEPLYQEILRLPLPELRKVDIKPFDKRCLDLVQEFLVAWRQFWLQKKVNYVIILRDPFDVRCRKGRWGFWRYKRVNYVCSAQVSLLGNFA